MKSGLKNVLFTLLTLALIAGVSLAVPQGSITQEAQRSYLEQGPAVEDEYAFLFE